MTQDPKYRLRRPPATPSAPPEDAVCVTQRVDRGPPGSGSKGPPMDIRPPGREETARDGPPQRVRLPDRRRPGGPSSWTSGKTLNARGHSSGLTKPWTTDHPPPLETWVDRPGDIRPPGRDEPNRAGPPQRVRLPDRCRPGDPSSRTGGQTLSEGGHGSGFTESWATEHRPPLQRWVDRPGGIYLPGVEMKDEAALSEWGRPKRRRRPGAPAPPARGKTGQVCAESVVKRRPDRHRPRVDRRPSRSRRRSGILRPPIARPTRRGSCRVPASKRTGP